MVTNKTATKKKKKVKLYHDTPKDYHSDYVILPLGFSYNRHILDLQEGELINLADGNVFRVLRVGILDLKSPATEGACFMRYGITIKKAIQIWKMNALAQGFGKNAISETECLIIYFNNEKQ